MKSLRRYNLSLFMHLRIGIMYVESWVFGIALMLFLYGFPALYLLLRDQP